MKNIIVIASALVVLTACSGSDKTEKTENKGVKVGTIKIQTSTNAIARTYSGTVEPESSSALSFATIGTVASVQTDEGKMVSAGQILATINATNARSAHSMAAATLKQAQDAYKRMSELHARGSLPEIQYIEAQTKLTQAEAAEQSAKKTLADCVLRAPFSGYIASRYIEVGNNVAPGMPAFELVRINPIEVKISVPETEVSGITPGQAAMVSVQAINSHDLTAKVKSKGVSASGISRSYSVSLILDNAGGELLPGMVCDVKLASGTTTTAHSIILPQDAVMLTADNKRHVWVLSNGKAVKRPVEVNGYTAHGIVISSGLSDGDIVITEGMSKVSEGAKAYTSN